MICTSNRIGICIGLITGRRQRTGNCGDRKQLFNRLRVMDKPRLAFSCHWSWLHPSIDFGPLKLPSAVDDLRIHALLRDPRIDRAFAHAETFSDFFNRQPTVCHGELAFNLVMQLSTANDLIC